LKKVQALASVSVLAWILALAKYWLRGLCWLWLKKVQALASESVLALDVV